MDTIRATFTADDNIRQTYTEYPVKEYSFKDTCGLTSSTPLNQYSLYRSAYEQKITANPLSLIIGIHNLLY